MFAGGAFYAGARVRAELAIKPAAFGASLDELAADREMLLGASRESRSALADSGDEILKLINIGLIAYAIGRQLGRAHR